MKVYSIACYIQNLNTDTTVNFNVEVPDQISESIAANYEDQTPRGRSSPFKSYINSGPHSISFSVMLCLDYRKNLKDTIDRLKDMLKPSKGTVIKPPRVRVRIGNVLNIKAVPLSFDFTWSNGYKDGIYRTCECNFSFDEVEDVGTFAKNSGSFTAKVPASEAVKKNTSSSKKATDYKVGEVYNLKSKKTGYYTASEALAKKAKKNPIGIYNPGTYYIYNKSKGMINITSRKGVPGGWINPK